MPTGTVNWFNDEKGFGFIRPENGSNDVFVHHSALDSSTGGTLAEGAKVEFETEDSDKGPRAVGVKLAS